MNRPALIVSVLALFVSLSAGAYAVTKAPRDSVVSKSIKNGKVKSADVKDDGLTGTDIRESTLELVSGDGAPTGPAGGDLVGTYPNPNLKQNSVNSDEINTDAVKGPEIATGAVGPGAVLNESLESLDLGPGAVQASELGPLVTSTVTLNVPAGSEAITTAGCPPPSQIISGGVDRIIGTAGDVREWGLSGNGWFARVSNPASTNATYEVEAYCLEA
jgi:hypothetical protein